MTELKNKRIYKVISLFIKLVILILSLLYIWNKLHNVSLVMDDFPDLFSGGNMKYILLIFLLMFVNWGLEACKWKLLISPLEIITFSASLKAVFAGVTISIFTPNRMGEFAARVFFLERSNKIKASLMSLIGSLMQLVVTIVFGVLAYCLLEHTHTGYFQTKQLISANAVFLLLIVLLTITLFIFFMRMNKFPKLKKYIDVFKIYSKKELSFIFFMSLARYIVFSIQYYFALKIFGINGEIIILLSLIAVTFFITSVIPTFALTEIAVRTGVAIYCFGVICSAHASIAASSLFLWLINLGVPALIGSFFVWKLKFFKEQK